MAEIPVEHKSSKWWLWALLALLLIGLLLWWALDDDDELAVAPVETAPVADVVTAPTAATADGTLAAGTSEGIAGAAGAAAQGSIAAVLANPQAYVGRDDFSVTGATVPAGAQMTDRGFWIENNGDRMFALIMDEPREVPKDINPSQTLNIRNGMIRDASTIPQLPGKPIDADTRRILEAQQAFLVVDEENIEIVSRPS